jgi:hypothetical protein
VADLLLAVAATAGLAALALAVLVAVTVAPFVVAASRAQRAGASVARVGAVALAACVLAVGGAALLVLRTDVVLPVAAVVLLGGWVVPPLAGRLPGRGRRGAHEPG